MAAARHFEVAETGVRDAAGHVHAAPLALGDRPNVNHASRRRPDFDQDFGMRLAAARFLSEEIRLTVRQAMRAAGAEGRYSPMILISTHLRRPPSNSP